MKYSTNDDPPCRVHAKIGHAGQMCTIQFYGEAAKIPSVSNSRMVAINRRTGSRFIAKNHQHQQKLEVMTSAYCLALIRSKITPPQFKHRAVYCLVTLANMPYCHDSHNYAKTIGDWLEKIGLIANDSQAEIDCRKTSDYPDHCDSNVTTIYIVDRDIVKEANKEWVRTLKEITSV